MKIYTKINGNHTLARAIVRAAKEKWPNAEHEGLASDMCTLLAGDHSWGISDGLSIEYSNNKLVILHSPCSYYAKKGVNFCTLEKLFDLLGEKTVEIVLNSSHTAVVTKDGIKVGCATFPLDIIDTLNKARDEVLND